MKFAPTAAALLATALFASDARAQCANGLPCKLSTGLDNASSIDPEIAPDGTRVVFIHTPEGGRNELFSAVTRSSAAPVRLTPAGQFAQFVTISPDSRRVLYTQSTAQGTTLYGVPIGGPVGARVTLAANVGTSPRIAVSPDGAKVVFASASADRLLVVPITGPASAAKRLTDPFVAGGTAGPVQIGVDSRSVVYTADQEAPGVRQLYRVPLTLTPAPDPPTTRLNGPLASGGDVGAFKLAPSNSNVIYEADESTDGVNELYRVNLAGGGRVRLSRTLPPNWDLVPPVQGDGPARIVPDGSRVLYEIGTRIGTRTFRELY